MGEKKLSHDRKFFNDCESRMMVSSPGAKHLVELQQKAQVEVIAPCLHAGLDWVSPLGIYRTFPEPMTFEGRTNDWVVFPLQHDPLFKQGRFPMQRRHPAESFAAQVYRDNIPIHLHCTRTTQEREVSANKRNACSSSP